MPTLTADVPPSRSLTAMLLIDAAHLDLARAAVRAGDPGLAMAFVSGDDVAAMITVNDVPYTVQFKAEPARKEALDFSVSCNVYWHAKGAPYPEHGATVTLRRELGPNVLSSLLELTEVVNALMLKVPTCAVVWLPNAAVSADMFRENYDELYASGASPVLVWILFGYTVIEGQLTVFTSGLADLGFMEIEFETDGENIIADTSAASSAVARMLEVGVVWPDGLDVDLDLDSFQGALKISYRKSLLSNDDTVCFFEFRGIDGGRPLPGVH